MIGTTKSNGKKDNLDKFYTKNEVALKCIKLIDNLYKYDDIIEPSAGAGSFSKQINSCKAYDIKPEDDTIIQADWFLLDKTQFSKNSIIIGNPPFGVQGNLASKFFNEAAKFAEVIAFVLPLSFKKDSVKNRLNLNFHLKQEMILPKNSFLFNDEDYDVPSVFQIWERKAYKRSKINHPKKSKYFEFVEKEKCDLRVSRVGGSTGVATLDLNGAKASNYYIKNNTRLSNDEFVNLINKTHFTNIEYTVGPKSLSRGEMVYELDKEIKKYFTMLKCQV